VRETGGRDGWEKEVITAREGGGEKAGEIGVGERSRDQTTCDVVF
jgi:hypothetical protein